MSSSEALKVLKEAIKEILNENTRSTLDKKVHVIDISLVSLIHSNKIRTTSSYQKNWNEFYTTVQKNAPIQLDYLKAVEYVTSNKGTCRLEEAGSILLISKNFSAARNFISRMSDAIPSNKDFGKVFRSIELDGSAYARYKDKMFLVDDIQLGYTLKIVSKNTQTNRYELVPVIGYESTQVKEVYFLAQKRSTEYSKSNALSNFANSQVTIDGEGKVYIEKTVRSVLDLGHGQGLSTAQTTPLGTKISNLLSLDLSEKGRALVATYIKELTSLHNIVEFEFKNTSDSTKASGYIVISIQNFSRNNWLAGKESRILAKLRKRLVVILKDIPGSNTITQDYTQILENTLLSTLGGKITKVKPHSLVKGKVSTKLNVSKPGSSTSITRKQGKVTSKPPQLRNIQGQFSSLTSLQNLLNASLAEQIKQNMGTGSSRNVLNYQSGRFANSAEVTRISESRAGMLTAFYTYMKYPYQTFEPGYRQGSPASRNPKLLIAKSIREIAGLQVANRMRAVSL